MAFAEDQDTVAVLGLIHQRADSEPTVPDLGGGGGCGIAHTRKHRLPDHRRILRSRVVVGHDHHICPLGGEAAHRPPFARIPVATATERYQDLAAGELAYGADGPSHRIRCMSVVNERREPRTRHGFHATRDSGAVGETVGRHLGSHPQIDGDHQRAEHVGLVVPTRQW